MPRGHLLGLLLAFVLLAAIYGLATPLFEAPDEPWHYAYVRWLAEGHGLPRLDDDASGAYQEVAQPPLYYAVAALMSGPFADDDLSEIFWHNPQFGYQAGGTVNDNKNMLIHTARERFPWRGAVLAVRAARLASLAFGLLTVGATYGLAREALPQWPLLATIAAAVVAFTPQFLFISGVVSNDSAAAAACTGALWALARILRLGLAWRRAAVAGLLMGLALLSKTSALLLFPLALVAIWRPTLRGGKWREALLMLSLAALTGGWWYLRNWILFDDPLGVNVHINTLWRRTEPVHLLGLLSELPQVFRSFWGAFGWGHVELPGFLYAVLAVLTGLGLVGWMRHLVRFARGAGVTIDVADTSRQPLVFSRAEMFFLLVGWCLAVLVALLVWMQQVEAPHGRLLFPALGAWGLLLTAGWTGLTPHRYVAVVPRYALFVPVLLFFLLSLIVPFVIIRPAFAQPKLMSREDALKDVAPQTLVYDGRVRLLGYRIEPNSVATGGQIEVTLCWEALDAIDLDYTLFIHLLGRDNARVGERTSYPGQGRFPTSLWPVGRAFCDSYGLQVAPWASAPELYGLEVGLYDAETGWRLPAQNSVGQPVDPPVLGLVRVAPVTPPSRPELSLSYDLGGQIALVGYDSSPRLGKEGVARLNAGASLTLTLYWQALQEPQGDYKVFVHLLDAAGALVTQDDALPRNGNYPTWAWKPGDLVPDTHQVTLPAERPPGPYHWLVGMYHPETGDRLPVVGPQGAVPDSAIPLERVQN